MSTTLEDVKQQLNDIWGFINEINVISNYENKGIATINVGAALTDISNRLREAYLTLEKYEQSLARTEETSEAPGEN